MPYVQSVGLDVSKATIVAAVCHDDDTSHTKTWKTTPGELAQLITWLRQRNVTADTPCIIESTGDFHLLSAVTLTRAGFTVYVINPIITKRYQRGSIRDAKTDIIDAIRLGDIGHKESGLRPFTADLTVIGDKKILSLIGTLEKTRQQIQAATNRFRATVAQLELPVQCDDSDAILAAIDTQLTTLYAQLVAHADDDAQRLAAQTRGVSVRQMAVLSAAVSGTQFSDRDQLIAYVGLDVKKRESGSWRGREKISKRGSPFVRKTLFQIGWGLAKHHPEYRKYYLQHRADGMHYYTVLLAIARKFLRYYYVVHCAKTVKLSLSTAT